MAGPGGTRHQANKQGGSPVEGGEGLALGQSPQELG